MLGTYRLVVADRPTGSGYAYVDARRQALPAGGHQPAHGHRPAVGGAGGHAADEPVAVAHVTAANEWAVDVGLAARLRAADQEGYLALRGHEAADAVPAQRRTL